MNEPYVSRNDDGTAELQWPDGVAFTPVAREVIEGWVETHNAAVRMYHMLNDLTIVEDGAWSDEITEAINGWTP